MDTLQTLFDGARSSFGEGRSIKDAFYNKARASRNKRDDNSTRETPSSPLTGQQSDLGKSFDQSSNSKASLPAFLPSAFGNRIRIREEKRRSLTSIVVAIIESRGALIIFIFIIPRREKIRYFTPRYRWIGRWFQLPMPCIIVVYANGFVIGVVKTSKNRLERKRNISGILFERVDKIVSFYFDLTVPMGIVFL